MTTCWFKYILTTALILVLGIFISSQCSTKLVPQTIRLADNWFVQSAEKIDQDGAKISAPGFSSKDWYPAQVPTTVLHVLVENGVYENPYFADNLAKIPVGQFQKAWWFRNTFEVSRMESQQFACLEMEGINYSANVWLNGRLVAAADSIRGAFRQFNLDVTEYLQTGENCLAVEVIPPRPGDFTVGFVDWNPHPPDANMGIFRPVSIRFSGDLQLKNPYVKSDINFASPVTADLDITFQLKNQKQTPTAGKIVGRIGTINFEKAVSLKPGETCNIELTSAEFPQLRIVNPRLWWPHNFGEPNLYDLHLDCITDGQQSDQADLKFGIRKVEDYVTESGHRGFKINDEPVLIKGGGWVDDLLLANTPENLEAQIRYVKHMNLNSIRLEGFWGQDQTLYDLCDRYGILVMVGWSCHWEWNGYLGKKCDRYGGVKSDDDIRLVTNYWRDQIVWLRNHPSIYVWMAGSDKLPRPALEKEFLKILEQIDPTRPCVMSASECESEVTGPTRMKMRGPYAFTVPVYWFADTSHGGAFGFNTETGPGAQIPPLSSLKKMLPADKLWPQNELWNFHCGLNEFHNLDKYNTGLEQRYGKAGNLADFLKKAQLMNYELMRPMFEAFVAHKPNSTGIIQWMLNSAWPEMYWQFYDSFLMPNGAFYGAQRACQPLHLIYDYATAEIVASNETLAAQPEMEALLRVYNFRSEKIYEKRIKCSLAPNSSQKIALIPANLDFTPVYFIDLRLVDLKSGKEVDQNFYWLATRPDVPDYEHSDWFYTPMQQYADFTALNRMPEAALEVSYHTKPTGTEQTMEVTLENTAGNIAFFINLQVVSEKSSEVILPVFWEDNYVSLLPGEKRHLQVRFSAGDLKNDRAKLLVTGWNIKNSKITEE
jgi:exo-1,4-beta-D-glucosaminidase